ncbi:serine carboxypeptidase-like 20 [Eucalyptus grandis]|uniref:serine carboxypeptidase-like 20 n=1 Tax=Eucalyptus grandis TaxID=71139 RepID=UPI00192EA09A|nr:serine carboxypeptidase-like 20 [Eucalyptus grandis]
MIFENFYIHADMIILKFICSITLVLLLTVSTVRAAPKKSVISSLPGFVGTLPSKHYTGYMTIDGSPGEKNLFYYFIVSERNPSKDPVVLWLNGGPACSSFDGFIYEHGPFKFQAGKPKESLPTLHLNPFSWSKVSNIIYLDSPCGVGLSYSNNPKNYVTGDQQTASDTHTFLLKWFKLYPEFLSNPFYISGESYAGVYVPTLASEVVKGIQIGEKPLINFKGYMVGNGVTDDKFDGNAFMPFAFGMGLISSDIYEACQITCGGKFYDPPSEGCQKNLEKVEQAVSGLNVYDILEPCYGNSETRNGSGNTNMTLGFHQMGVNKKPLPKRTSMFGRASPFWSTRDTEASSPGSQDEIHVKCVDDEAAVAWLNNEAVRKAIHAAPVSVAGSWWICAGRVSYSGDTGSMIPYHKNLTSRGYRVLIYSGDHDMRVPFTGTQAWTRSLGYKIIDEWRPWMTDDQVAGYLQGYDNNFTFLKIKGAGHMVAQTKPREALEFYSRWLDGKPI